MTRPKLVVVHSEQQDMSRPSREGKRYRFDLSRKKFFFLVGSLAVTLCWMFILGILVGRGIALVSTEDFSLRAEFMRFLGLGKQAGQPAVKAAETWGDPRKMIESLNYYEDLTQRGTNSTGASASKSAEPDSADPATATAAVPAEPVKETVSKRPPVQPQQQAPPEKAPPELEKPPRAITGEQFTLLVASLKDPENARKLLDQLSRKGYSPRLETLDLHGGGRWNRVLVGSFQSRETALKFASEFNKKENMEGLVIRVSD